MSSETWILICSGVILLVPMLVHAASSTAAARGFLRERTLILGMTPLAEQIIRETEARVGGRALVVGVVDDLPWQADGAHSAGPPLLGPIGRLSEIVDNVRPHRIVVALAERRGYTPVQALLESCVMRGILVEEAAQYYERLTGQLAVESLTPISLIFSGKFRPSPIHQALTRAVSLLVAIVGLACSLPLLGLIAVVIKLESAGPVFFVQPRVGANRRPFKLLKFRTMHVTVAPPRSEWAADNEARVTRVGRWLRALRLDELPQFINILRGEMNLVGPRPHPVCNLELFTLVSRNLNDTTGAPISYYHLRSIVRPGLTGWAQVRYRYANNLEEEIEKLRYDLYYVKHVSIWLDLRILAETCKVILSGALSDGIEAAGAGVETVRARPLRSPGKLNPTSAV